MGTIVTLVVLGAIVLYAIYLYNTLVKLRQMAAEGWSGIDVQLKRRADLIPNLLESVKGYMQHEKEVLENVTRARAQVMAAQNGSPGQRAAAENILSGALGRLMAVAENYPDLKASQNFLEFQRALEETENEISLARRYYNGAARNLNIAAEAFPSVLIARQFGFDKVEYFEIEDTSDRATPQVSFG
ncbi:LemA family protein [Pseudohoeflea coraliihabitans]|uniref:LemA family protein n=1 Tax=Pseudohoeflea coraliihabitans TaxID=2860393 RepID=A0ABS6WLX3_9HYPH|nr:LemA family protein [Pseudohoeflea sp. DP4N28-3]MBW3096967.1 LemA family protein [Pseudohoeflea sp. DP4N28-3]